MGNQNDITAGSVELDTQDGVAFIEQASPLTRLHYFDGKFLKADALAQEQAYHRTQVRLSNLAGGWGVVNGLGIGLAGDQFTVGGGLAITPAGHFVFTVGDVQAKVADLLKVATASVTPGGNTEFGECAGKPAGGVQETASLGLYEITVGPIEGLCGNEPVYGALCESACVSDSRHPYWREGLVLRLRPITLQLPTSVVVPFSNVHLRNRMASAYFAIEPGSTPPALSASGLASGVWCQPASLYGRDEVVIGLLAREGGVNRVIDAWSGRRERMEAQARGYWQGRMAMRPWNVFLAQILQFQCQLSGVFSDTDVVVTVPDNCDQIRAVLDDARKEIEALQKTYAESTKKLVEALAGGKPTKEEAKQLADQVQGSYADLFELSEKLSGVEAGQGALPANRLLLNSGFVQLPPAGYLPVQPGKTSLQEQLQRLFGEGVRLYLRAARADVLPHLLEEAQHMERISLTKGLDQPSALEEVEIFVPDGQAVDVTTQHPGTWWSVDMSTSAIVLLSVLVSAGDETEQEAEAQSVADKLKAEAAEVQLAVANNAAAPKAGAKASAKAATKPAAKAGKTSAQARAGTAKASVPLTGTARLDAAGLRLNTNVKNDEASQLQLQGLARTEGDREDGSFGLALAVSLDPDLLTGELTPVAYQQALRSSFKSFKRVEDTTGSDDDGSDRSVAFSLYLSTDIAKDPFDLAVGDDTTFKGELRQLMRLGQAGAAGDARVSGTLSVLSRQTRSQGRTALVIELDMVSSVKVINLNGQTKSRNTRLVQRLGLVRQGDGRTGVLLIDDEQFDAKSPPLNVDWDESPRLATVTMSRAAPQSGVGNMLRKMSAGNDGIAIDGQQAEEGDADTSTFTIASLQGLNQAPQPASPIGSQALTTLVSLSDATSDSAFLARARKRLFPSLDAAPQQDITAVLDWVLFRRRRPTFCDPACVPPVAPDVEAFQVWHIKVDSEKELKALRSVLDNDKAEALSNFKLQPVGVLRYQNDSTEPEETPAKVLAMWQQAAPGNKVVLGCAWETTPTAGQGWQNHFRLRAMLARISSLTTPPPQGDGSITTLAKAPAPLAGQSLDGGFLVVTIGAKEAVANTHRVLLVDIGLWADVEPSFKSGDYAGGWKALNEFTQSPDQNVQELSLAFKENTLTAAQTQKLVKTDQTWEAANTNGNPFSRNAYRLDASVISNGVKPEVQSDLIAKTVGGQTAASYQIPGQTDLGGGAEVLTVIVYDIIYPR
ncbi:MAG: hypothetical protein WAQ08_09810 [Aquabacterium sp.]|jgi:hypothetical protein|uniref:hypothetical protein n=1 Tax=Aquabacterium sp. TaxID=1872578 RepID=UPI003BAF97C2